MGDLDLTLMGSPGAGEAVGFTLPVEGYWHDSQFEFEGSTIPTHSWLGTDREEAEVRFYKELRTLVEVDAPAARSEHRLVVRDADNEVVATLDEVVPVEWVGGER